MAIRPQLLAMINEPDRVVRAAARLRRGGQSSPQPLQLAKTVALCIGKIARLDYGIDWYGSSGKHSGQSRADPAASCAGTTCRRASSSRFASG
mgnify:CR=1 FL=1